MTPGELLTQTRNGLHLLHESHFVAAKRYDRLGRLLGGGAAFIAAGMGATALKTLTGGNSQTMQLVIGIGGVVAAVLASLQTFLNYPSLAERHRSAAQRYGALRRDADRLAAFESAEPGRDELAELHQRWDEADKAAPGIPARIIAQSPGRIARQRELITAARQGI